MKNNYKLILITIFACSTLKLSAACTAPSSSAGTPVLTCQSGTVVTVTWTAAGSPCSGYVLVRTVANFSSSFSITDGTALPTLGGPKSFGGVSSCYIEYVGSNLTSAATATSANGFYYVIPYNNGVAGCTGGPSYKTTSVAFISNTRPVPGIVSDASFTHGTTTAYTIPNISFSPAPGGADGYLVCTNPNDLYQYPTNGTTYNVGDVFNNNTNSSFDQTVQYVGTATSGITASTNLAPNKTYAVNVYAYWNNHYSCSGGPYYVFGMARITGSATTALNVGTTDYTYATKETILIYPNPSSGEMSLHSSSIKNDETVTITVLNLPGEIVRVEKIKWSDRTILNVNSLAAGVYFLRITSEHSCMTARFVRQ